MAARRAAWVAKGRVAVSRDEEGAVAWSCETCNQVGVICGFGGTAMDLSPYVPRVKTVTLDVDDDGRKMLLAATQGLPALRAVVARAAPHKEVRGLLLIPKAPRELDEVYTLVEGLSGRGRRQREVLEDLLASLCSCIDRL